MGWTQPFPPDAKRHHFETLYKLYKTGHFGAVKIGLGRARSLSLRFPWLSILHHLKHALPNSPSVRRLILIWPVIPDATKVPGATNGASLEKNGQILRAAYAKSFLRPL
uniref:Uncharacterized protein n=1 Tax=Manihot esculenta TaxID=3983 RepID=A0A2C9WHM3_MANES